MIGFPRFGRSPERVAHRLKPSFRGDDAVTEQSRSVVEDTGPAGSDGSGGREFRLEQVSVNHDSASRNRSGPVPDLHMTRILYPRRFGKPIDSL